MQAPNWKSQCKKRIFHSYMLAAGGTYASYKDPNPPGAIARREEALLEAIQRAKVEAFKIPEGDREQMICEYSAEDFEIPPHKTEKYTIIEIATFAGRSLSAKRRLYEAIVRNLGLPPINTKPDDILIGLHEISLENWGIDGRPASEVDIGHEIKV